MAKEQWRRQDEAVERAMGRFAGRRIGSVSVIGDGWHRKRLSLDDGKKLCDQVPDGGWIAVIGQGVPAAAYAMACRELGLVDRERVKVLEIAPVKGTEEEAIELAEAGVVVAYHTFLREVHSDLLGEACEWKPIGHGRRMIWAMRLKEGWRGAAGVFPEIGEDGELGIVSDLAARLIPNRRRCGEPKLDDVLARMFCDTGGIPDLSEEHNLPDAPVVGPLRTEAGRSAMMEYRKAVRKKEEWRAKAAENGLELSFDFFSDGEAEKFEAVARLLEIGNRGAVAGRIKERRAAGADSSLSGFSEILYEAPSKTVLDAIEGMGDERSRRAVFRVKDGAVFRGLVFGASEVEADEDRRAAIALVPEGFEFSTWLNLAVLLDRDRGYEWWYPLSFEGDAHEKKFACPEGCDVALDLIEMANGEDWLAGDYETEMTFKPSVGVGRSRRRQAGKPDSLKQVAVLADDTYLDADQLELLRWGELLKEAKDIVLAAAGPESSFTPSEWIGAARRLAPVLSFGRDCFPVDELPAEMDTGKIDAAAQIARTSSRRYGDAERECGMLSKAAKLWREELRGYGLVVDATASDERMERIADVGAEIGLESAVGALYAGVELEDILA